MISFRVAAEPHACRHVRAGTEAFARRHGVGEEDLGAFLTAFGEALANAIEHSRSSAPIDVTCQVTNDAIVATVADRGIGFVASTWAQHLPGLESERGRGMHIMRRCSDIFDIRTTPGGGAAVRVGRHLKARAGGGGSPAGNGRVAAV